MLKGQNLILLIILLAGAMLRFYRLPEMSIYEFDQEYASNFAYSVIREFPIQLIGQQLSVQGLFMGPLYFYYLVPFFVMSNLHPIGGFAGSVILGLVIVSAYFLIGRKMFGATTGIILATLRAFLFEEVRHDWSMVPSYSSELLVLVTWYCFYRYWKGDTKLLPLLGLSFGLFTSFHPILFPFYFVFMALLLIKRKIPSIKTTILSLAAFILPVSPLILFEYFHKFLEVKRLFSFFVEPSQSFNFSERVLQNLQTIFFAPAQTLSFYTIPKEIFSLIFIVSIVLFISAKSGLGENKFHKIALAISLVVFLGYYTFFPSRVSEYYFRGFSVLLFLYFGALLGALTKNKVTLVLFLVILGNIAYSNIKLFYDRWQNPNLSTFAYKDSVVKEIVKREVGKNEFYVSYIKEPGWDSGFSYLFKLYGQNQEGRIAKNRVYTVVMPKSLSLDSLDVTFGNVGLILPD